MHIVDFLETVPVLSGLKREELERLSGLLASRQVAPDEVIIREGDPADEMFIVVDGKLSVLGRLHVADEEELNAPLHSFGRGDFFGDMSFFDHQPRSATIVAATAGEVLALKYTDLEALIQSDGCLSSRLFAGMMRNMSGLMRHANQAVRCLYGRLIMYDDNFRDILRMYSADEELSHLFKRLTY